jgi:thioredoxin-like negative regulator of GroEL
MFLGELSRKEVDDHLNTQKHFAVMVSTPSCIPCKFLTTSLSVPENSDRFKGVCMVGKIMAEDVADLCEAHSISTVPTILLFRDNKVIGKIIGVKTAKELLERISALIVDTPEAEAIDYGDLTL